MPTTFQLQSSAIVSEIIDGEAIILDLRSGVYFSAQDAAAVIWDGLIAGFSTTEIEAHLCEYFIAEPAQLQAGITALVAELIANGLIETATDHPAAPQWSMLPPASKLPFAPPVLNRYGDLQDLAKLDPIHDVAEEAGWPNPKAKPEWPNRRTALPSA